MIGEEEERPFSWLIDQFVCLRYLSFAVGTTGFNSFCYVNIHGVFVSTQFLTSSKKDAKALPYGARNMMLPCLHFVSFLQ
jgi:hypothetical protein